MIRNFFIILFIFASSISYGKMVETIGEAEIINNDKATAKKMALSRAKWSAIEEVSEIKIKLDTVINNSSIIDEAIKSEVDGTIKDFQIIDEGVNGNVYWVSIKADVIKNNAQKAVNIFSKNTSIAIIIPALLENNEVISDHLFNKELTNLLSEKGFQVVDVRLSDDEYKKIALNNDLSQLRKITDSYMANTILIGKIDVYSKGNNAGYTKVNFSIVSGELNWQLVGKKDNVMTVFAKGTESSRGQGATSKDAAYGLLKNMSKNVAVKVASNVSEKVIGNNEKIVRIILNGDRNINHLRELKEDIKNIPFVLNIQEKGVNEVIVNYPEKTYFLGAFISNKQKYSIIKLTENELIIERR